MRLNPHRRTPSSSVLALLLSIIVSLLASQARASVGDKLPEFRHCVDACVHTNCAPDNPTPIPVLHRLLLWTCPAECDHTCQHIITQARQRADQPVVQFHGKWPFTRVLGAQEPLSVLFSLGNLYAHVWGLRLVRAALPLSYPLRPYYERIGQLGVIAWTCSAVFHTRDLPVTERADYLAAGASVLYGLYYAAVRVGRLDRRHALLLQVWTLGCAAAYAMHVLYLLGWTWDYSYNMAANVAVGTAQNVLWSYFCWTMYRRLRQPWAVAPGVVVAWVVLAMSLELFDFAPLWGFVDAHCLWHLGTIAPAVIMYK